MDVYSRYGGVNHERIADGNVAKGAFRPSLAKIPYQDYWSVGMNRKIC